MLQLLLPGHVLSFLFSILHPLQDLQHDGGGVGQWLSLFSFVQNSMLQSQRAFVVCLRLPRCLQKIIYNFYRYGVHLINGVGTVTPWIPTQMSSIQLVRQVTWLYCLNTGHLCCWVFRWIWSSNVWYSDGYCIGKTTMFTVGIWNLDLPGFQMVEKRLVHKWTRFEMGSEIWKPNHVKTDQNYCHLVEWLVFKPYLAYQTDIHMIVNKS